MHETRPETHPAEISVLIVGLGHHGLGIGALATLRGYQIVGAVEVDDRAGSLLCDYLPGSMPGAAVFEHLEDAINSSHPNLAILATTTPLDVTLKMCRICLENGVNVVALPSEIFDTEQEWRAELDAIGKATGASFLATGVQDIWWVQLPALAAGATSNVQAIRYEHEVDLNTLPMEFAKLIGVGQELEHSNSAVSKTYVPGKEEFVLAPALVQAARKMGANPVEIQVTEKVLTAQKMYRWSSANSMINPGEIIGIEEHVLVTTDRNLVLEGTLRTFMMDEGEAPRDRIVIEGEPSLIIEQRPFPGEQLTNTAAVNRIPDVINAPGGILSACDLGPTRSW